MANLNPDQEQVASHRKGRIVVLAGPGSGKCVAGDTLIATPEGTLTEIARNDATRVIGFGAESVEGSDRTSVRVGEFVDSGIRQTRMVETVDGHRLIATLDHPIAVLDAKGVVVWRKMKDIRPGDHCAIVVERDWLWEGLDDDFYLMGLLLGDGSMASVTSSNKVGFTGQSFAAGGIYHKLSNAVFGRTGTPCRDARREELYNYVFHDVDVKNSIRKKFGDIDCYSHEKYLTREMLAGTRREVASLVRGLMDTDGHAGVRGAEITLSSERLIRQLQIVLLRLGVYSVVGEKTVNGISYYRLFISGSEYRQYMKAVGFSLGSKLADGMAATRKRPNANRIIPLQFETIRSLRDDISAEHRDWYCGKSGVVSNGIESVRLSRYLKVRKGSRQITRDTIDRLSRIFGSVGFSCPSLTRLEWLRDNFVFTEVASVSDSGNRRVYDYCIPGSHNFVSGGFLSHNTATLTERSCRLLSEGVVPSSMLQLTFTNKARDEMKERLLKKYGEGAAGVEISNFHGLCQKILRRYGKRLGLTVRFTVAGPDDQTSILRKIARKKYTSMGLDDKAVSEAVTIPKLKVWANALNHGRESLDLEGYLDDCENRDEEGRNFNQTTRWIMEEYLRVLKAQNQVDLSGMLSEVVYLLENHKEVRDELQARFQWIQVDEYQDTNGTQNRIVELIAGPEDNVLAVGDVDQSIYGFRGAGGMKAIEEFRANGNAKGGCKTVKLGTNYRSTPQIVELAKRLIRCAEKREEIPFKAHNADGDDPKYAAFVTVEKEGEMVVDAIEKLINEGMDRNQIAVLYRAASQSQPVEVELAKRNIPYRVSGGKSFYDRMEINDCLCMLKFLSNPKDMNAFSVICNKPARGLGEANVSKIEQFVEEQKTDGMHAITRPREVRVRVEHKSSYVEKGMTDGAIAACEQLEKVFSIDTTKYNAHECLRHMLGAMKYGEFLKEYYGKKGDRAVEERKETINRLLQTIDDFCRQNPRATISDYLQSIALFSDGDDADKDKPAVSLMTMHKSKGLEFDAVFVIGCEENLCPHERSIKDGEIEEERRIMYVAMTRARKRLRLTSAMIRRSTFDRDAPPKATVPSRFLTECQLLSMERCEELVAEAKQQVKAMQGSQNMQYRGSRPAYGRR